MYVSVCVSVCLSVSVYLDYLKKFLTDFDEIWQEAWLSKKGRSSSIFKRIIQVERKPRPKEIFKTPDRIKLEIDLNKMQQEALLS